MNRKFSRAPGYEGVSSSAIRVQTKSSRFLRPRTPGSWRPQRGRSHWIDASALHSVSPTGSVQREAMREVNPRDAGRQNNNFTSFTISLDLTPLRVRSRLVFSRSKAPFLRSIRSIRGFLRPLDASGAVRASVIGRVQRKGGKVEAWTGMLGRVFHWSPVSELPQLPITHAFGGGYPGSKGGSKEQGSTAECSHSSTAEHLTA